MSAGLDHSEEMLAEVDEPPDDQSYFSKTAKHTSHAPSALYTRAQLLQASRRESLLTRQLNSENEHSTEDEEQVSPSRGLSTASVWSTQSTTSTAELTSDDGRSLASPTASPPLRPAQNGIPVSEKPLSNEPRIVGLDALANQDKPKDGPPEKSVEAGLGRKRCITFACGNKGKEKPVTPPTPPPSTEEDKPTSPPKRKCMIKFACPARAGAENKPAEPVVGRRAVSPPPPQRRTSQQTRPTSEKAHRGSDSTVTHVSPKNIRTPSAAKNDTTPKLVRRLSNGSDSGGEGTRFHEFATSDEEPEEWIQESTCWRSRLTVSDTLKKENIIRQLGEEVDEEALEEEDEDDLDDDDDAAEEDDEDEDDELEVDELEEDSDEGFHSDDEEGFAGSDSDGEDSEYEWWTPAGRSTAATSMDHHDHHLATNLFKTERSGSASSIDSSSSGGASPTSKRSRPRQHKHSKSEAVDIQRPGTPDLPDSTDFVCGTLDEDRPLEQAYITRMKEREAAKHKLLPQDIDPTFPTSDPEMDEEDDEDIEDLEESESDGIMHGDMDPVNEPVNDRRTSLTARRKSSCRSPPPPMRNRSPAPRRSSHAPKRSTRHSPPPRAGSPAPRRPSPAPAKRSTRAGSPAPRRPSPAPKRVSARAGSPAPRRPSPAPARRSHNRSPPPPVKRSATAPVKKLFGQSPQRMQSRAPGTGMTSPPNTRHTSPSEIGPAARPIGIGLGARPAPLTHTASLPRTGGFQISRMDRLEAHDIEEESDTAGELPLKKRGAIDIVKGLEKKRLRRKEKMHQKACAKAAAKGEKLYKVKPGKGCERMREVGLELQRYKGKGEHILSV